MPQVTVVLHRSVCVGGCVGVFVTVLVGAHACIPPVQLYSSICTQCIKFRSPRVSLSVHVH